MILIHNSDQVMYMRNICIEYNVIVQLLNHTHACTIVEYDDFLVWIYSPVKL